MKIEKVHRVFWSLNLLYLIDIALHDYSTYSRISGFISFFILFFFYLLGKNFRELLLLKLIEPMVFFILAIFVATSTMTVAFFYISLNLMFHRMYSKPLHIFFRPTMICIYLFAGLNKLSPGFRSGEILLQYLPSALLPYSQLLSLLAILCELSIAVLLFLNQPIARYLTLVLHLAILVLIPTDLLHFYSLAIYGTAMTLSVNLSFNPKSRESAE